MFFSTIHQISDIIPECNSAITIFIASHSSETELLQKQIEFLEHANIRITDSYTAIHRNFGSLLGFIQVSLAILVGIAGLGIFAALRLVKTWIEEELKRQLAQRVDDRIDELEQTLNQVAVLKRTQLYYFQPNAVADSSKEFEMIKNQIPHSVFQSSRNESRLQTSNLVVLDLVHSNLDETEEGKAIAKDLATTLPQWSTLILYTPTNQSPVFNAVKQLSKQQRNVDYAIANMKLTLMDRVIGAAYASDSMKR